jgi:ribosome maturation factor RimP
VSSHQVVDRLQGVLSGPLAALGFDVEAVELTAAGKRRVLRVAVDKDGGVSLDDVAEATREASRVLDGPEGSAVIGQQPYTLEVSSPGTDRPLVAPRHWRRNQDRLVTVTLVQGGAVTGRIVSSDEERAVLDVDGTEREVAYDEVARAKVQIEFNRKEG